MNETSPGNGRGSGFLHWPTILQLATLLAILSIPALGVYVTMAVRQATTETEIVGINFRLTQDEGRMKEMDQDERAALADLSQKVNHMDDSLNEVRVSIGQFMQQQRARQ